MNVALTTDSGMNPWVIEAPNPAILAPGGSPNSYKAAGRGTATIMASERPICNPGQICPHFIRAFQATVVVA